MDTINKKDFFVLVAEIVTVTLSLATSLTGLYPKWM